MHLLFCFAGALAAHAALVALRTLAPPFASSLTHAIAHMAQLLGFPGNARARQPQHGCIQRRLRRRHQQVLEGFSTHWQAHVAELAVQRHASFQLLTPISPHQLHRLHAYAQSSAYVCGGLQATLHTTWHQVLSATIGIPVLQVLGATPGTQHPRPSRRAPVPVWRWHRATALSHQMAAAGSASGPCFATQVSGARHAVQLRWESCWLWLATQSGCDSKQLPSCAVQHRLARAWRTMGRMLAGSQADG
jgi:hypothetical protein